MALNIIGGTVSPSTPLTIDAKTSTTYTFALTDANNELITADNSSAQTYSIPTNASVAFPIGAQILFIQGGPGPILFAAGSGATIKAYNGYYRTAGTDIGACAVKCAANTWRILGDLIA